MNKDKGRPYYPAVAAASEKHKRLEAEKSRSRNTERKERRKRISQRRINPQGRRVPTDRRVIDRGPGCRGYPERRKPVKRRIVPLYCHEERRQYPGRWRHLEDHPGYVKGSATVLKQGIRELSRKLLEESKKKMAEVMFFRIPEVVALMAKIEAEGRAQHSGVTDVMRGVQSVKADPPGSGQLEAVPARCDNCLFLKCWLEEGKQYE